MSAKFTLKTRTGIWNKYKISSIKFCLMVFILKMKSHRFWRERQYTGLLTAKQTKQSQRFCRTWWKCQPNQQINPIKHVCSIFSCFKYTKSNFQNQVKTRSSSVNIIYMTALQGEEVGYNLPPLQKDVSLEELDQTKKKATIFWFLVWEKNELPVF